MSTPNAHSSCRDHLMDRCRGVPLCRARQRLLRVAFASPGLVALRACAFNSAPGAYQRRQRRCVVNRTSRHHLRLAWNDV